MSSGRLPTVTSQIPHDLRAFVERVREFQATPVASIASGAVSTGNLVTGAVGADQLAEWSVTEDKLATGAVTVDKISFGAADINAMDTTHVANSITALGGTPAALGTADPGSGTAVALSNHVHTLPTATAIGAASLHGGLDQIFQAEYLILPTATVEGNGAMHGPWDATKGGYSWQTSVYKTPSPLFYGYSIFADDVTLRNQANTDYVPGRAKKWLSKTLDSSPNRTDVGFWMEGLSCGISSVTANELHMMVGTIAQGIFNATGLVSKTVYPGVNNTYSLGSATSVYTGVWATDTTINTSDLRRKEAIVDCDLGLDFIAALRPVCYRWREKTIRIDADPTTGEDVPVIGPGVRPHYGLIAQEVKSVLGDRDFAGYVHDGDADVYALRYTEFIAPLIKAVQELTTRLEALEQRVDAL